MTPEQLSRVMPYAGSRVAAFGSALDAAMDEFAVTTPKRIAAFIAQVAVESGELRFTRELASGEAYEGRADLGNTSPGDGARFRGAGLLMLTGRANFEKCGTALNLPLIANPSLLEIPGGAARSAGWFWSLRGLNELADADKFGEITHRINGGYHALDSRLGYWLRARAAVGL